MKNKVQNPYPTRRFYEAIVLAEILIFYFSKTQLASYPILTRTLIFLPSLTLIVIWKLDCIYKWSFRINFLIDAIFCLLLSIIIPIATYYITFWGKFMIFANSKLYPNLHLVFIIPFLLIYVLCLFNDDILTGIIAGLFCSPILIFPITAYLTFWELDKQHNFTFIQNLTIDLAFFHLYFLGVLILFGFVTAI